MCIEHITLFLKIFIFYLTAIALSKFLLLVYHNEDIVLLYPVKTKQAPLLGLPGCIHKFSFIYVDSKLPTGHQVSKSFQTLSSESISSFSTNSYPPKSVAL